MSNEENEERGKNSAPLNDAANPNYSLLELQKLHAHQQQILMEHFSQAQLKMSLAQDRQRHVLQMQLAELEHHKSLAAQEENQKAVVLKKLEELKKKNKDKESAEASSAVKEILRNKIQSKQKEKGGIGSPPLKNQWGQTHHGSLEQQSPPAHGSSPPYRAAHLYGPYDDLDHPLRKVLSEPVMTKHPSTLNLKEHRVEFSSPRIHRRYLHRNRLEALPNSNPDSGPNSPHSSQVSTDSTPGSCEDSSAVQHLNKMISLPDMTRAIPHLPPPTLSNAHDKIPHTFPAPYISGFIPPSFGVPFTVPADSTTTTNANDLLRLQHQYAAAIAAVAASSVSVTLNRTTSAPIPVPNAVSNDKLSLAKQQLQSKLLHKSKELRSSTEEEEDVVVVGSPKNDQPLALVTNSKHLRKARTTSRDSPPSPLIKAKFSSCNSSVDERSTSVGLVYDEDTLKHDCICGEHERHPEHPGRLKSIWTHISAANLVEKSIRIKCRKASMVELQTCHSEPYSLLYGTTGPNRNQLDKMMFIGTQKFYTLPCGGIGVDPDTVWNEEWTPMAARMAAGGTIELAHKVLMGEISNGFALVRPPGHHAEPTRPMGFCYFNNIAIATKSLLDRAKLRRILVVDWDVHHGNSTQSIFYADSRVLYISLHRHDDGNFFPGTGAPTECGIDMGLGFNVNIAFSGKLNPPMGDAEYLAAFRSVVMPIALSFEPEIVLVSAGFDGASGHPAPLGGYNLSPALFGWMTKQLKQLAQGRLILVLEGGYELTSTVESCEQCVRALLSEQTSMISDEQLQKRPFPSAVSTIEEVVRLQQPYWPFLDRHLKYIDMAHVEWCEDGDTVSALASQAASLSMAQRSSYERSSSFNSDSSEPMEEV